MADYYAKAASNTFHVADADALRTTLKGLAVEVCTANEGDSDPNRVYLISREDKGRWPNERWDQDSHEGVPVDLLALIAGHLLPGEVAVLKETGAEKASYLGGRAEAVNHLGETESVELDEIFERAKVLGGQIARDV